MLHMPHSNATHVSSAKSLHEGQPRECVLLCSWRRQPWLWLIGLITALAMLLVIIVCALLVGNHPPRFVAGPAILATAGYSFDTSMAVDHSGFIYYTVIPSEQFLDDLDPG